MKCLPHYMYAIIVSFNPEMANLISLIEALNAQGVKSIVIDNGTVNEQDADKLNNIAIFKRLEENAGIAKAQNIGIDIAKKEDAKFLIFFDQDSQISSTFIHDLIKDFNSLNPESNKIAAIGPTFTDSRYGFYYKVLKIDKLGLRKKLRPETFSAPFEASVIISSGMLMPIDILDDIGVMNESLFIDYVDTEWCLRAVSKGYKIYVATSAVMSHAIGDAMVKVFIFNVPVHSPFRRYYRVRNGYFLTRMPHIPPLVKLRENIFNIIHQFVLIATQKNKRKDYIKSLYKGIKDGLRS